MLERSAILLLLALMLPAAHAEMVTFRATGTITGVNSDDGFLPIIGRVGDAFTIDYTFDTQTPEISSRYDGALTQVTLHVGASTIAVPLGDSLSDNSIVVSDNAPSMGGMVEDYYQVNAGDLAGSLRSSLTLTLYQIGWAPSLLTGTSLSSQPPDVSLAATSGFVFSVDNFPSGDLYRSDSIFGRIDSLSVLAPVPIPAASWMLISGLLLLRRFRSRLKTP